MNSFKQAFLLMLAVSQRSNIGLFVLIFRFVLIFLLVSGSSISNVHASVSRRISSQVGKQQPAQASEVDTLVQTAYELYEKGKFDNALSNCAKAEALSPNDF